MLEFLWWAVGKGAGVGDEECAGNAGLVVNGVEGSRRCFNRGDEWSFMNGLPDSACRVKLTSFLLNKRS